MVWLAGLVAVAILWFGIRFWIAKRGSTPPFSVGGPGDPPAPRPRAETKPGPKPTKGRE